MTNAADLQPVSMTRFDADFDGFAADLGAAFRRYGFAVVSDHGLDQATIDGALAKTAEFFALPDEIKRRRHIPGGGGARGYTPFGVEAAKGAARVDLKEFWHVGRDLPPGHPYAKYMAPNVWPDEIEDFEPLVKQLFAELDELGRRILEAIAVNLGQPRRWFDNKVALGNSVLRLLHYPPVAEDAVGVRAGAHEDINVITLLLGAEEAGLEILDRDGQWLAVNAPPGAVVCNVGDMLQRLTCGQLPSTTHRVANPAPERRGKSRYSTPFFLHFEPEFLIEPLPSCAGTGQAEPPITADDYLQERLREIKLK